jgi:hypothetical protein
MANSGEPRVGRFARRQTQLDRRVPVADSRREFSVADLNRKMDVDAPDRHPFFFRVAAVAVALFLAVLAALFLSYVLHSEQTFLTIKRPDYIAADVKTVPVKLQAFSGQKYVERLYTDYGQATVHGDKLTYSWTIPKEFVNRDTLVELCFEAPKQAAAGTASDSTVQSARTAITEWCYGANDQATGVKSDGKRARSNIDANTAALEGDNLINANAANAALARDDRYYNNISCAYFVPAHSRGFIAALANWNDLSSTQAIGCVNENIAEQYNQFSYIQMLGSMYESLGNALTEHFPYPGSDDGDTLPAEQDETKLNN